VTCATVFFLRTKHHWTGVAEEHLAEFEWRTNIKDAAARFLYMLQLLRLEFFSSFFGSFLFVFDVLGGF